MPGLLLGPVAIQRVVAQVDSHRYDEHLEPGRFSLREAIAHLADWEPILLGRIHAAVTNPGSAVEGIDEGERAKTMNYAATDPNDQAGRFLSSRLETVAYLQSLSPEQFQHQVVHNERGPMSVYDMANMLIGHDMYHIEHLSQYLTEKTAATW